MECASENLDVLTEVELERLKALRGLKEVEFNGARYNVEFVDHGSDDVVGLTATRVGGGHQMFFVYLLSTSEFSCTNSSMQDVKGFLNGYVDSRLSEG